VGCDGRARTATTAGRSPGVLVNIRCPRRSAWSRIGSQRGRCVEAAIREAVAEGEPLTPRLLAGEGVGGTANEFIARQSALMDIEDHLNLISRTLSR
jgi:hypothetical protein